jgi:hypothetical protein
MELDVHQRVVRLPSEGLDELPFQRGPCYPQRRRDTSAVELPPPSLGWGWSTLVLKVEYSACGGPELRWIGGATAAATIIRGAFISAEIGRAALEKSRLQKAQWCAWCQSGAVRLERSSRPRHLSPPSALARVAGWDKRWRPPAAIAIVPCHRPSPSAASRVVDGGASAVRRRGHDHGAAPQLWLQERLRVRVREAAGTPVGRLRIHDASTGVCTLS